MADTPPSSSASREVDSDRQSQMSESNINLINLVMEQCRNVDETEECYEQKIDSGKQHLVETATHQPTDSQFTSTGNSKRQCSFNSDELFRNENYDDISDDLVNKQISNEQPINDDLIDKFTINQINSTNHLNDKLAFSEDLRTAQLNGLDSDLLNRLKRRNCNETHQSNEKVYSTYNTFAQTDRNNSTQSCISNSNTNNQQFSIWTRILNRFNNKSSYTKIDDLDVKKSNEKNINLNNHEVRYIYQQSSPQSTDSLANSSITNFFQSVISTRQNMTASNASTDQSPDHHQKLPFDLDNKLPTGLPPLSRANSYLSSNGIQLRQSLGLLNGVCIIVGVIVGSGIFISPKGVLETSHSVGLSLSIWICCGLLSLIGALCYAELGCAIPKSGGDYAYIREAFGDLPAFLFLWVATLIIMPTGNAIAALTFANYVLVPYYRFVGCGDPPEQAAQLIAVILVCFLTFINCYKVTWSAFLMDAFTFAKIFALTIIIGVGFWQIMRGSTQNFENAFQGSSTSPQQIALSFYVGLFSYAGWNFLNFVTEELKDPFRTLPKAIYISLPLVTTIYVLTNVAYFTVLSPTEIVESNAVAITFGDRVLGIFSWTMPVFVVLSTFGGLNGSIFTSSRLFFVGARNGHLPRILGQINVHYVTPVPSLLFMCFTTLVYLSTPNVYLLINYTGFNESLFITLSVAGLIWLRYKQPDLERPIKVNICLPIFFFVVCTFLVLLPVFEKPTETGISALITLTGIPVYLVTIAWKNKPAFYNRMNDSITKFLQVLLITIDEKRS